MVFAVIVDIVGSRKLEERRGVVQEIVLEASDRTHRAIPAIRQIASTAGDEFQGTFGSLTDALHATLFFRLALPKGVECRFGVGRGDDVEVSHRDPGIRDGSAWWNARDAIDLARHMEKGQVPSTRTFCKLGGTEDAELEAWVNAVLIQRDQIVTTMRANTRRLLIGVLEGRSQTELAGLYQVTQGTVSSNLRRGGPSAILEAWSLVDDILGTR